MIPDECNPVAGRSQSRHEPVTTEFANWLDPTVPGLNKGRISDATSMPKLDYWRLAYSLAEKSVASMPWDDMIERRADVFLKFLRLARQQPGMLPDVMASLAVVDAALVMLLRELQTGATDLNDNPTPK
jgi:hypothetical protein